jgi:hypothetical protein
MSNHSGSYMINEILSLFHQEEVFDKIKFKTMKKLLKGINKIASSEDCNPYEMYEDIGSELGYCSQCDTLYKTPFDGVKCQPCQVEDAAEFKRWEAQKNKIN